MKLSTPRWWYRREGAPMPLTRFLLRPLSLVWAAATARRIAKGRPADLDLPDGRYDRAVLFLLLHEQPDEWRRKTLAEAWRVVRPGGRIVIVDYARPKWWSPFRYIMPPALALLEPFALDVWRAELQTFLRPSATYRSLRRESVFGGLYQAVVFER